MYHDTRLALHSLSLHKPFEHLVRVPFVIIHVSICSLLYIVAACEPYWGRKQRHIWRAARGVCVRALGATVKGRSQSGFQPALLPLPLLGSETEQAQ